MIPANYLSEKDTSYKMTDSEKGDASHKMTGSERVVRWLKITCGIVLGTGIAAGFGAHYTLQEWERLRSEKPYPNERMDTFDQKLNVVNKDLSQVNVRLDDSEGVTSMMYLSYKKDNPNATWAMFRDELATFRANAKKAGAFSTTKK